MAVFWPEFFQNSHKGGTPRRGGSLSLTVATALEPHGPHLAFGSHNG